jgi:hypothetical protein
VHVGLAQPPAEVLDILDQHTNNTRIQRLPIHIRKPTLEALGLMLILPAQPPLELSPVDRAVEDRLRVGIRLRRR